MLLVVDWWVGGSSYGEKTCRILEFAKEKKRWRVCVRVVSAWQMLIFNLIIMRTFSQVHEICHLHPLMTYMQDAHPWAKIL
jgi:hypothetical protein